MFKKFITIMMVVMVIGMVIGGVITTSASHASEDNEPDIVGIEYIETIIELEERWENDEIEIDYSVESVYIDGYWMVVMEGESDEYDGYMALGIYDHTPSDKEIDILWANRMLEDELYDLMEEYGF
jgi:hypothetical protein